MPRRFLLSSRRRRRLITLPPYAAADAAFAAIAAFVVRAVVYVYAIARLPLSRQRCLRSYTLY